MTNVTLWGQALTAPMLMEGLMLLCFGLAWPVANMRMLHRRQAEGKGLVFTAIILCGYLAGAASKLLGEVLDPVFWLYVLNLVAVGMNLGLQWHFGRRARPARARRGPLPPARRRARAGIRRGRAPSAAGGDSVGDVQRQVEDLAAERAAG